MTIVASVKVRDGLILATDSMTQVYNESAEWAKAYENARKLFQMGDLPVGVMTYGAGNFGNRSVEGVMLDFGRTLTPGPGPHVAVGAVAQDLYTHVKGLYTPLFSSLDVDQQPVSGFVIAGYDDPKSPLAEIWEFQLPRDSAALRVADQNDSGAIWRGIDIPFTRLWKGFDPRLPDRLVTAGLVQPQIDAAVADLEFAAAYDGMPIQDAIDFAVFIVETHNWGDDVHHGRLVLRWAATTCNHSRRLRFSVDLAA